MEKLIVGARIDRKMETERKHETLAKLANLADRERAFRGENSCVQTRRVAYPNGQIYWATRAADHVSTVCRVKFGVEFWERGIDKRDTSMLPKQQFSLFEPHTMTVLVFA